MLAVGRALGDRHGAAQVWKCRGAGLGRLTCPVRLPGACCAGAWPGSRLLSCRLVLLQSSAPPVLSHGFGVSRLPRTSRHAVLRPAVASAPVGGACMHASFLAGSAGQQSHVVMCSQGWAVTWRLAQGLGYCPVPSTLNPTPETGCRWPLWLAAAGVLTAAAVTNPSREELLASMGSRLVGKQGFWTGVLGLPLPLLYLRDCPSPSTVCQDLGCCQSWLSKAGGSPQRPGWVGYAAQQAGLRSHAQHLDSCRSLC